jgi:hypothetical protein
MLSLLSRQSYLESKNSRNTHGPVSVRRLVGYDGR